MADDTRTAVLQAIRYGLYVATSTDGTHRYAWAANWLTQCSFDPPAVALAARRGTSRALMIERGGVFAVNVMEHGQAGLVSRFYRPVEETADDLGGVAFTPGSTGCPLLDDALGSLECRVRDRVSGGDHVVFVGEVVDATWRRDGIPLALADTALDYGGLHDSSRGDAG